MEICFVLVDWVLNFNFIKYEHYFFHKSVSGISMKIIKLCIVIFYLR
ncbi:hypothetical protein EDC15_104148 [Acetobacter aceti NBRC 14818]|nr:hypothetical protein EDC15_104148 [Acetobacter aceti NBRC 14818]